MRTQNMHTQQTAQAQLARLMEDHQQQQRAGAVAAAADRSATGAQRDAEALLRAAKREAAAAQEEVAQLRQERQQQDRRHDRELNLLRVTVQQREGALAALQTEYAAAKQALARAPSVEAYERQLLTKDAEIQLLLSRLKSAETTDLQQRKLDGSVQRQ